MTVSSLIVLVADKDIEETMVGLLARPHALMIRQLTSHSIVRHPNRDPGCCKESEAFLRPFLSRADHALVLFDHEGCGQESKRAITVEEEVESKLAANGWKDQCAAIAIEPEVEAWVWTRSPVLDDVLGWGDTGPRAIDWLAAQGYDLGPSGKPLDPKRAFRDALRASSKPPSSSLFRKLAEQMSFRGCQDRAFTKLLATLQRWFPVTDP
ncbi:MAG: hypothetical protein PVI30_17535 [Myxococcales bacterium]|jgi:hypothetical protein